MIALFKLPFEKLANVWEDSIDKLKECNYFVKKLVSNDSYSAIFIDHEKNK